MHILFLTDNFPPEVNAPASRTHEHAKVWVEQGHDVTVITCTPNFPYGKVFDGYSNRLWQREYIDGIKVIRVWTYITENKGFSKRILDFMSFMFASFFAAMFVRRFDVVIGTSPQFFTACSGLMVGLVRRKPFVFELRDLWPETIKVVDTSKSESLYKILEWLELFLYKRAKLIISVTNSFKKNLIARGIDSKKIMVVTNGVDIKQFTAVADKDQYLVKELGIEKKFVAGYIGTHGLCQKLETLVDAAAYCQNKKIGSDVYFLFVGDGSERQSLIDKAKNLKNVHFVGQVSKADIPRYWSVLDISIVHLLNDETFKSVIPSKIFECLAMNVPILIGVEGESKDIICQNNAGVAFTPESHLDLVNKIQETRDNPTNYEIYRNNCLPTAKKYSRKKLATEMMRHLIKLKV